jgi:hypothetical protein
VRAFYSTAAVLAAAAIVSSLASPVLAKSQPRPQNPIEKFFSGFSGGSEGGGHRGGHHHHGKKTYTDIPGTPATEGTKATETIVYFGTCNNLAGVQQAGNADANGFCLPFESLVGSEASAGSPGSGPSCAVTTRSRPTPSLGRMSSGGSNGTETTTIVSGTCDSIKPQKPDWPNHPPEEVPPSDFPPGSTPQ